MLRVILPMLGEHRRRDTVEALVARYVQAWLAPMRTEETEETEVLPLAESVLGAADWAEIDAAFQTHRDPLTGFEADAVCPALCRKIPQALPPSSGIGGALEALAGSGPPKFAAQRSQASPGHRRGRSAPRPPHDTRGASFVARLRCRGNSSSSLDAHQGRRRAPALPRRVNPIKPCRPDEIHIRHARRPVWRHRPRLGRCGRRRRHAEARRRQQLHDLPPHRPGANGPDGLPPIGPAWPDVAAQYRGLNGAPGQLTRTVMTGFNPQASHWKAKVSGLAMPPNEVACKEAAARVPFGWVLALDAWKQTSGAPPARSAKPGTSTLQ